MASPLAHRAVSVLLPALLVATLPDARGLTCEDKAGLAHPVGIFMSGARVGGNMGPTRGGSFPLGLLEKGNEVAHLDDSSFMGKRMERPLLSRVNTKSSSVFRCWPSHTSNRPPPPGQNEERVNTFA